MRPLGVRIIGAGVAGLMAAIRCREVGIDDVVVYEKADRLGGTWRENTYPGVACDVPSHLYSYSFAPNPGWTRTFAQGAEILAYLDAVARDHGLDACVRYGEEVTRLERRDGRWLLTTASGTTDEADVVIAATGVLHHPYVPDLPGLDAFRGPTFHTARWDHDVELDGARVGVIGTGSSAIQVVGALAGRARQVALFQRTAQWVLQVPNQPIVPEDRERYAAHPDEMAARRKELSDNFEENFADAVVDAGSPQLQILQELCEANLATVRDPELRERLRPDHRPACKRLIISPDFYEAIQRPGVELVTAAIDAIDADGVRTADGARHDLDVLVLATGFRVDRFLRPAEVIGADGTRLDDLWTPRPTAYLSVSVPGLPNLFLLNGPNGPVGNFSLIEVAELQMGYVLQLVEQLRDGRCREISASRDAAERHEAERVEQAAHTVWVTGCRSWYLDDRGIPAAWPWSFGRFRAAMAAPDLADFELVG